MLEQYLVCLDPGHGPETANTSPDGTYLEREFTWDMCRRLRRALEAQGLAVILTRTQDEKPSLTQRARVSNAAGADLFLSVHSNAAGSGWSEPRGVLLYTSAPGVDAPRNIAARDILEQLRLAGVTIWGNGLSHEAYTVLVQTTAPAVLIEYGFHTNRAETELLKDPAYRELLAKATTKGICQFFGVIYREDTSPQPAPWAAAAWGRAVELGILDGTAPQGTVTREMLAVVLGRIGALDPWPARLPVTF